MPSDYLPDSFENRLAWFKNLHDHLGDFTTQLGWSAQQVTDFKAFLAPHLAGLQAIVDAQTALDQWSIYQVYAYSKLYSSRGWCGQLLWRS